MVSAVAAPISLTNTGTSVQHGYTEMGQIDFFVITETVPAEGNSVMQLRPAQMKGPGNVQWETRVHILGCSHVRVWVCGVCFHDDARTGVWVCSHEHVYVSTWHVCSWDQNWGTVFYDFVPSVPFHFIFP